MCGCNSFTLRWTGGVAVTGLVFDIKGKESAVCVCVFLEWVRAERHIRDM